MPKPSPFHSRTADLVESYDWQIWSGYLSANAYELEHTHEYNAVRTSAGVFDISPLYKYYIDGPDAGALLDRVLTRDVTKLRVGQVAYTTWCDDDGKIIDDGTVARLDDSLYRLTAADPTERWLEENATGLNVHIEDVTERFAGLSVQGPTSRAILQAMIKEDLSGLKYFRLVETTLDGTPVVLSRTGFTGDLGYELFAEFYDADDLWDKLMRAGGPYNLRPMGNTALDMTRIEAGLLLTDVDFVSSTKTMFDSQKSTPLELGLGWTVKLEKPYFIGQAALKKHAPKEMTIGLELDTVALEQLYARFGMPLHLPFSSETESVPVYADARGQKWIGKSTSRTWSPILKKYIGLARVEPRYAALGTRVFVEVTIEAHRLACPAKVVEMPFFNPARKRD
ncbi:MAG TPA: aminomethyltransferase family protein [Anaerolineales bacterium]|nr:aminomethyltransferase family protein [Anaerolineales bacterium]